ncbi:hypothetical protein VTK56DRAFT_2866 [Thermocarpiscus australiensis]
MRCLRRIFSTASCAASTGNLPSRYLRSYCVRLSTETHLPCHAHQEVVGCLGIDVSGAFSASWDLWSAGAPSYPGSTKLTCRYSTGQYHMALAGDLAAVGLRSEVTSTASTSTALVKVPSTISRRTAVLRRLSTIVLIPNKLLVDPAASVPSPSLFRERRGKRLKRTDKTIEIQRTIPFHPTSGLDVILHLGLAPIRFHFRLQFELQTANLRAAAWEVVSRVTYRSGVTIWGKVRMQVRYTSTVHRNLGCPGHGTVEITSLALESGFKKAARPPSVARNWRSS